MSLTSKIADSPPKINKSNLFIHKQFTNKILYKNEEIISFTPPYYRRIATFVAFHACSSDENNDPQPMTKTQLLLKKSKEFAQKYNVDLEVDEAQLEKVADMLSVEQMERDYQAWVNFTKNDHQHTQTS